MKDPKNGVEIQLTLNDVEKIIRDALVEFKQSNTSVQNLVRRTYKKLLERGLVADQREEILGFDHVAVLVWDIEQWTERYIRLGARVIYDNSDMSPSSPSSAKLRGLKWGNLLIALLEPINREEKSQVYHALSKHGDHFFQHIAIRVENIRQFKQHMEASGACFVGDVLERSDAFGPVRQIFGQIFDKDVRADEGNFWEFVERPKDAAGNPQDEAAHKDFDDAAAEKLYKSVESAARSGKKVQFIE